tara:strand:+ start:90 stop:215 length:126 start_codon:yes stop_codon:yes gene_type:complete
MIKKLINKKRKSFLEKNLSELSKVLIDVINELWVKSESLNF